MTPTFNRRTFALLPFAMGAAKCTPQPLAAQTPVGEISRDLQRFTELSDDLRNAGQSLVEAFLASDGETFVSLVDDPELASLNISDEKAVLESNRIRLRWKDGGLLLDGSIDASGSMIGFAWNQGPLQFVATPDSEQSQAYPTGTWSGVLAPDVRDEPFVVTFEGDAQSLSAMLDLPAQDLTDIPVTVTYSENQPIGARIQDQALPLSPVNQSYRSEHVWGDALLTFDALRGPDGGFVSFSTALYDLLPVDPALGIESGVTYALPTAGPLFVFWGGPTEFQNYHASTPAQRPAIDLVRWENGSTFRADGMANDDYLVWGESALAPAAGQVVAILNDQPDIPPVIAQSTEGPASPAASPVANAEPPHPAGNHVVIKAAAETYVDVAHLQQGSITVQVGDAIELGDEIGLVGNSGNTSEPHIHVHAQNVADLLDPEAFGLRMTYDAYIANGQPVTMQSPVQGQFVEQ